MKRCFLILGIIMLVSSVVTASPSQQIVLGNFSTNQNGTIPADWEPMTFSSVEKHTDYQLVGENGVYVLKAESSAGASGLRNKVRFDPRIYPFINWRWKVNRFIERTDVTAKSGDDYAVRLYVSFDYDLNRLPAREKTRINLFYMIKGFYPPLASLNYIWAGRAAIGSIVPSPYTDRVRMVVLKNQLSRAEYWHVEERNILEDYRKAFGDEPGDVISIAVMTDTDNTGEKATSFYGDIVATKNSVISK